MKTSAYIAIFALLVLIVVISVLVNFSREPDQPHLSTTTENEEPAKNKRPAEPPAQPPAETVHRSSGLTISPVTADDEQETSYAPPLPPNRDAARPAAAEGAVLARHIIDGGDNYTKLAEKYYRCSGRDTYLFAQHIERANPDKSATNLQPRSTVIIPALTPELSARLGGRSVRATSAPSAPSAPAPTGGPDLSAYRIYMVQHGDSLAKIARVKLGSERKWKELFELNKKLGLMNNPDDLKENQLIVLGLK